MNKKIYLIFLISLTLFINPSITVLADDDTVGWRDKVTVDYILYVDDVLQNEGTLSNVELGIGLFLIEFEEAIIGMRIGETKNCTIPPEEGYDPPNLYADKWLVFTITLVSIDFDASPYCFEDKIVDWGDTVTVYYILHVLFVNGTYTFLEEGLLEDALLGADNFIIEFEEGIIGMQVGESKNVTIPPEGGYDFGDLADAWMYFNITLIKFDIDIVPPTTIPCPTTTSSTESSTITPTTSSSTSLISNTTELNGQNSTTKVSVSETETKIPPEASMDWIMPMLSIFFLYFMIKRFKQR